MVLGSFGLAQAQSGDAGQVIAQWQASNVACRNVNTPALEAVGACERRDTLSKILAQLNYCYGPTDKVGPGTWVPCAHTRAEQAVDFARTVAQFQRMGGVFVLPIILNGNTKTYFVVDSGAANIQIPQEIADELTRKGTLNDGDFLGERSFAVADGRRLLQRVFRLRSVQIGTRPMENVLAAIGAPHSQALLGQSMLKRLDWWKIDNIKNAIELQFTGSF